MARARKQMTIRPRPAEIPVVRATFDSWLAGRGVGSSARRDLELVVCELTANAVEASAPELAIEIAMEQHDEDVEVRVTNCGPESSVDTTRLAAATDAPRGRGLPIVRALSEDLTATYDPPVTTVSCRVPRTSERGPLRPADARRGSARPLGHR
jgi:anti-sigma regulatory factor (Ser/Thr protein kinase)